MSLTDDTFEYALDQLSIGAFLTLPERADDRLVVGILYILIIFGILANIALILTVLRSKEIRINSTYYLLVQIAASNLIMLLSEAFFRVAGIVFRQAYLGSVHSPHNYIILFFTQCAWWSFVFSLTLTAFIRFVCIFFVGRYDRLFTRNSMRFAVLLTSLMGISMASPHLSPCCRVLW
ncbi:hypothetical protein PENTCL1PPCAC_13799, partial [Pristionchus entomophagus]